MVKPGYKQTEVGIIPKDWICSTVEESYQICNNLRFPISDFNRKNMQGIYPYYGPTKIQDYINEFRINGVYALIGEDGDHFLKFKQMSMTQLAVGKFNVNNHAHLVKGSDDCTTKWFYYFFKNRDITPYISRQGAGRYKLNKDSLNNLYIAIPPKKEQERIAEALADADGLISSLEKLIAKKKAIKQGTMQQLLTGKNRLDGFSGEWVEKELGEITKLITKGTTPTSIGKCFTGQGINFIKIECIDNSGNIDLTMVNHIDNETNELLRRSILNEDDIIFSIAGALGKVAKIHKCHLPANTNQALAIIRVADSNYINVDFILFQLKSKRIKKLISEISVQGAQANLSLADVSELTIPFPTLAEQTAIANILSDMDNEIKTFEKKLAKYRQIKQGMMQELLTGRIRLIDK